MQTRIAIVGGGPGALAAAHSLMRFGFPRVRVFERAAAYGPAAGSGFGLAFNGASVLQALGFGDAVSPALAPVRNWHILDGERRGALVASMRGSPDMVAKGGLRDATLSGTLRTEVVDVLVQGRFGGEDGVAVATDRRVLFVNDREWKPDVQSLPYVHGLVVKGWQDDRTASLIFEFEGRTTTIEQIGDRELAQRVAALVRTRVA